MDEMEEMIGNIFAAKTLHECGRCLEEFAQRMGDISDPGVMEDVSDYFWERLAGQSALNLDFDDPENRGWMICPPELQVLTYLDISLIPRPMAEEDVTYLLETGQEIQRTLTASLTHLWPQRDFRQSSRFWMKNMATVPWS